MSVKYPKIKFDNKQRVFVVFYHNNKRYRLSNGSKVNIDIYPNSYPIGKREEVANLLGRIQRNPGAGWRRAGHNDPRDTQAVGP